MITMILEKMDSWFGGKYKKVKASLMMLLVGIALITIGWEISVAVGGVIFLLGIALVIAGGIGISKLLWDWYSREF